MLQNPRLKSSFSATFINENQVLLASEKINTILNGEMYSLVLAAIVQHSFSLTELITHLEKQLTHFEIFTALQYLQLQGFLTEADTSLPSQSCAYWESSGIEPHRLQAILAEKSVSLQSVGPLSLLPFQQALESIPVVIRSSSSHVDLKIVLTDDYGRVELRQLNQEALRNKQAWMLLKPTGVALWLGPLFLPGESACWECLKQRLTINRPMETFYQAQYKTSQTLPLPLASTLLSSQIAFNHAALEVVKYLYFGKSDLITGKIITIDTGNMAYTSHTLVKRPQCPGCGDAHYRIPAVPIVLNEDSTPIETTLGGFRQKDAEETLARYKHHISPITGVVQVLRPYFSIQNTPIYNYSSGHNMALQSKTQFWLNQHVRSASGGKGKTWSQAKAGALCEAIERYSLMYHGDEPFITTSLSQLGQDGIHPNVCMNFSQHQFNQREETNRTSGKFYSLVPMPFAENQTMAWSPVYSLTAQRFKYLPTCFCYAQYPADDEMHLFSYPDSNGCAAGNSIEEAILQGFLELVERDAVAIWWYNRLAKPAVDISSFNDPYFFRLANYYQSIKRSLYILELTTDLGIPTFAAISHRLDDPQRQNIVFGFGSHVSAKIAIERALVELNQLLPIALVPEEHRLNGNYRTPDKAFVDWLNTATIDNQAYLKPNSDIPIKKIHDYPQLCTPSIYHSLVFCLERVHAQGLETLVLDLTRPDIGLPVARVFVPGMRHFWKRLAPGRLYDVPVKMGWLNTPLKEEDLNPLALFI